MAEDPPLCHFAISSFCSLFIDFPNDLFQRRIGNVDVIAGLGRDDLLENPLHRNRLRVKLHFYPKVTLLKDLDPIQGKGLG